MGDVFGPYREQGQVAPDRPARPKPKAAAPVDLGDDDEVAPLVGDSDASDPMGLVEARPAAASLTALLLVVLPAVVLGLLVHVLKTR